MIFPNLIERGTITMALFHDTLNHLIDEIGCHSKDLSEKIGLSAVVISRYRTGVRTPGKDSDQMNRLATGLACLAQEAGREGLTEEAILKELRSAILTDLGSITPEMMQDRLNALINATHLSLNEIAHALNYDPSYLSKIRTGKRIPADPDAFVTHLCDYIAERFPDGPKREELCRMIATDAEEATAGDEVSSEAVSDLAAAGDDLAALLEAWFLLPPSDAGEDAGKN